MSAHTPGPWIYGTSTGTPGFQFFVDGDSSLVADVAARPEAETNARLISAAPELADALEAALPKLDGVVYTRAYQALVKAGRLP